MRMYDNAGNWTSCGTINSPEIFKIRRHSPEYFTVMESWSYSSGARAQGKYIHGSATATITHSPESNSRGDFERLRVDLDLNFKLLGDGQALYELIRAGKITPIVSFDGKQADGGIRQFRDLAREFLVLCRTKLRRLSQQLELNS